MNIPTIGGPRGIFEIFVPGTFLLLNLGIVVYLFPLTDSETKRLIAASASNAASALIIAISFGYLMGVLLRLFRTDFPDKLSAGWLRIFSRRENPKETKLWAKEEFPYIGWIGETCKLYLSDEVKSFFDNTWGRRRLEGQNKQFFNFVKSADQFNRRKHCKRNICCRGIKPIYLRNVLCTFFLISFVACHYHYHQHCQWSNIGGLIFIAAAYLLAIIAILANLRFVRIKEVEAVFAASFKYKELFEEVKPADKPQLAVKG